MEEKTLEDFKRLYAEFAALKLRRAEARRDKERKADAFRRRAELSAIKHREYKDALDDRREAEEAYDRAMNEELLLGRKCAEAEGRVNEWVSKHPEEFDVAGSREVKEGG